jgi:hypothetical protein
VVKHDKLHSAAVRRFFLRIEHRFVQYEKYDPFLL